MKNTYYFSHDYHASKDPKCSALINDFGMTGYGLYWCIVEILHEQGGKLKKFPKLFDGLAFELKIDKELLLKQIEAMVQDYNLLQEDDNFIWSERVLKNINEQKLKYQIKAEAGRIGGLKSGETRKLQSKYVLETKQNEAVLEANELKESKVKESKVNKNIDSEQSSPTPSQIMLNFINNSAEQEKVVSFLEERGITRENSSAEIKKFLNYWCELTKSGRQQRWQTERTFELRRRLATWFNNAQKFNKTNSNVIRSL